MMTVLARREVTVPTYPAVGVAAQFGVLLVLSVTVGLGPAGWLAGAGFATGMGVFLGHGLRRSAVHRWGPADTVTLARLTLTGGVAALVAESIAGSPVRPVLVALAAVALVLDAVDGQVARRTRTSPFGARFDMEADSVLVLLLSVFVASAVGWWVVAIGLMRYAFVAASWALPWLRRTLPPRIARKAVAALQGTVLVVAGAALVPVPQARAAMAAALAFLIWSFGSDIGWLWRRRRAI
jgi:phosphatidylglycerophosphate synthase